MNLFKKNKDKGLSQTAECRAAQIADRILSAQRRAADYLNSKTAGISGKSWMILLICFCAAFGSYCLVLLLQIF